ncbi:MAG: hydrogenase nickel incorporation protein HypB [Verrucomicrobiota bacterium]|jgi:hydrogenase nickel incorporation protein HypB
MCNECGCGLSAGAPVTVSGHDHPAPGAHEHLHDHPHHHHSSEPGAEEHQTLDLRRAILEKNDRLAERNRGFFRARGILVLNVLSSPGSGKTTLIRETIRRLGPRLKTAVIVGDLATDNDARRLRDSGAPVVQINTGTVCHLEADMVARAWKQLDTAKLDLLIIENVGNLVCPASYDLGEDLRVVLLSVTDGEDKPLKYPPVFHTAHAVIISKVDLDRACDFNREAATANIRHIAHHARLFEISAKAGTGMDDWCDYLIRQHEAVKGRDPLAS